MPLEGIGHLLYGVSVHGGERQGEHLQSLIKIETNYPLYIIGLPCYGFAQFRNSSQALELYFSTILRPLSSYNHGEKTCLVVVNNQWAIPYFLQCFTNRNIIFFIKYISLITMYCPSFVCLSYNLKLPTLNLRC